MTQPDNARRNISSYGQQPGLIDDKFLFSRISVDKPGLKGGLDAIGKHDYGLAWQEWADCFRGASG